MSEVAEHETRAQSARNLILAVYILQAAGLAAGITAVAGVIINYLKRDEARGTVYESHFTWQIRTFWWALLWLAVGSILAEVLIGFVVLAVAGLWYLYRIARGLIAWSRSRAMEA